VNGDDKKLLKSRVAVSKCYKSFSQALVDPFEKSVPGRNRIVPDTDAAAD